MADDKETETENVNRDLFASVTRADDIRDVIATVEADGGVSYEVRAGEICRPVKREDAVAIAAILAARHADSIESEVRGLYAAIENVEDAIGRMASRR